MKTIIRILLSMCLLFALSGTGQATDKYNVSDGTLSDWGIVPFDWTKVPLYPTVKYTIQDFTGIGDWPDGGEAFDIEAMYFDADDPGHNAYFAIITSYQYSDGSAGDLAIDLDNNSIYEYGIVLDENSQYGAVYKNPDWKDPDPGYYPENGPFKIVSDTTKIQGYVIVKRSTLKYENGTEIMDGGFNNYLIEGKIDRSYLGNPQENQLSNIHLTMWCGNDEIEIGGFKWTAEIPEFPTIAIPIASVLGIVFIINQKKGS